MALSSTLVSLGILVGIYAILAIGLNIKYGYTGLLEIGHVAFFLIGAHVTALLMLPPAEGRTLVTYVLGWGWPWLPSVAVAVLVAGLAGGLVALPAVRLREDYLAIAVLGLSVILQFVVRNEGWLANGTDGLYGISRPLGGYFPLPSDGTGAAVVLGATVAVLWGAAAYAATAVRGGDTGRVGRAAMYVSTAGAVYAARRLCRRFAARRVSAGVGAAAGFLASVSYLAVPIPAILVFLGGFSVFSWSFAASAAVDRYAGMGRAGVLTGLGLAVAPVVALSPLFLPVGGAPAAAVLVVLLACGVYRLARSWDRETGFVRVVGLGLVALFGLRYFVIEGVRVYVEAGGSRAALEVVENVLWMVRFDATDLAGAFSLAEGTVSLGYSRFLLAMTFALVGCVYYLSEATVRSPFGRVLKAVREDEDVANSLGKDVFSYKVRSMFLGSALAGLAGGVFAVYLRAFSYSDFAPEVTFIVLLIVVVGGTANNAGAVLGSAVYWGFQRATQDIADLFPAEEAARIAALRRAMIGVVLILVLYHMPEGILRESGGARGSGTDGGDGP